MNHCQKREVIVDRLLGRWDILKPPGPGVEVVTPVREDYDEFESHLPGGIIKTSLGIILVQARLRVTADAPSEALAFDFGVFAFQPIALPSELIDAQAVRELKSAWCFATLSGFASLKRSYDATGWRARPAPGKCILQFDVLMTCE